MDSITLQKAAAVAQNGFSFVQDGQALLEICANLANGVEAVDDTAILKQHLATGLMLLDRQFGWDLAGRSQAQEDDLYTMLASLYIAHR